MCVEFSATFSLLNTPRSRIIVKNVPTYLSESRLREHFSSQGTITDVKLLSNRRFGFVGFKSDAQAKLAREYFDRTFIDSTRISVEVVQVS